MKTRIHISLGFAAGLLFLSGCTTVNSVENANKEGQRNMVTDERAITDASLNRKVNIVGVNTSISPDGFLRVQVELQNHTSSLQRFMYRFEWFDANGMQVNNVLSASIPDQIEGQEDKSISCIAPNPSCRDFRVKFIDAD
jgi:uncharacterized protein YcfL